MTIRNVIHALVSYSLLKEICRSINTIILFLITRKMRITVIYQVCIFLKVIVSSHNRRIYNEMIGLLDFLVLHGGHILGTDEIYLFVIP